MTDLPLGNSANNTSGITDNSTMQDTQATIAVAADLLAAARQAIYTQLDDVLSRCKITLLGCQNVVSRAIQAATDYAGGVQSQIGKTIADNLTYLASSAAQYAAVAGNLPATTGAKPVPPSVPVAGLVGAGGTPATAAQLGTVPVKPLLSSPVLTPRRSAARNVNAGPSAQTATIPSTTANAALSTPAGNASITVNTPPVTTVTTQPVNTVATPPDTTVTQPGGTTAVDTQQGTTTQVLQTVTVPVVTVPVDNKQYNPLGRPYWACGAVQYFASDIPSWVNVVALPDSVTDIVSFTSWLNGFSSYTQWILTIAYGGEFGYNPCYLIPKGIPVLLYKFPDKPAAAVTTTTGSITSQGGQTTVSNYPPKLNTVSNPLPPIGSTNINLTPGTPTTTTPPQQVTGSTGSPLPSGGTGSATVATNQTGTQVVVNPPACPVPVINLSSCCPDTSKASGGTPQSGGGGASGGGGGGNGGIFTVDPFIQPIPFIFSPDDSDWKAKALNWEYEYLSELNASPSHEFFAQWAALQDVALVDQRKGK